MNQQSEPGRNEPCPCGSGKKYKKCHYLRQREADEEARQAAEDRRRAEREARARAREDHYQRLESLLTPGASVPAAPRTRRPSGILGVSMLTSLLAMTSMPPPRRPKDY